MIGPKHFILRYRKSGYNLYYIQYHGNLIMSGSSIHEQVLQTVKRNSIDTIGSDAVVMR